MRLIHKFFALALAFLPGLAFGASGPFRAVPGKGAQSKTLLVYTQKQAGYSLLNALELLRLQLGRVDCSIETLPLHQFTTNSLANCDYLVVLSLDSGIPVPVNLAAAIVSTDIPVLWVGSGIEIFHQLPMFRGQFEPPFGSDLRSVRSINYRGKNWEVGPLNYRETRLSAKSNVQIIITPVGEKSASLPSRPLCWKSRHITFFSAEPSTGPLGFIFEDILLDFFSARQIAGNTLFIRLSGYDRSGNHREFKRMADYLHARSIPFGISMKGLVEVNQRQEADSEFLSALRYAQQRGGRIILADVGNGSQPAQFWDKRIDRPRLQMNMASVRQSIIAAGDRALRAGLLPIAWETPQNAASSDVYREIAAIFGTAAERVQLSDATCRDNYAPAGLIVDSYGRLIVPENLGFLPNTTNALAAIEPAAELLSNLRGTILGSSFDCYLPFSRLVQLVEKLETYGFPFLDLADLGNRVLLPDKILLTGNAAVSVKLQNATVRWKTYNRAGQLLAEDEQRTRVVGQHEFKRIGIGVYELVQFNDTQ